MELTKKVIMPRKDAEYYNRLGGLNKLVAHIDKNFSVCELPVKDANYLIRIGGNYKAYDEVSQASEQIQEQEELI